MAKYSRKLRVLCAAMTVVVGCGVVASVASAAPALRVRSSIPDYVSAGKFMTLVVSVQNDTDAELSGNLVVRFTFPAGVSVGNPAVLGPDAPPASCERTGQVNECVIDVTGVRPDRQLRYRTLSAVSPTATGVLEGKIEISGEATGQSATVPIAATVGPRPPFGIKRFDIAATPGAVQPAAQAASSPAELATAVEIPTHTDANLGVPFAPVVNAASESYRDVTVHVPPGLLGMPTATLTRCTAAQLAQQSAIPGQQVPICPQDSQIGLVQIVGSDQVPLYNIVPPRGVPAVFGFYYQGIVVMLRARVRPSDNGIDLVTVHVPNAIPVPAFEVTIWGTPADESHDYLRPDCILSAGFGNNGEVCTTDDRHVPFLRLPTSCTGAPLSWLIEMDTYEHPGVLHDATTTTPALSGCDLVPFDPGFTLRPSTRSASAPAGLDATLVMPQEAAPDGLAQADLRKATVTLPEGMTINPSSADGLQACGDAELRLRQEGPATCPDASKIGTVSVTTPLLDHEIGGSIFVRPQNSSDPASGELFRIAVELRSDDDGIAIRLPAAIKADPATGRLTTVFEALPQLPFSAMTLHFKSGPRAPLASPGCGNHAVTAELVSWSGRTVSREDRFTVDQDCPTGRFTPVLSAGSENPIAGASSKLHFRLTRSDADQELSGITATLPKGLLGRVGDVAQCSDADATAGTCGAQSLVGRVITGAGAGSNPFYVTAGRAYLTGPYKGAPFGLAMVVPAAAGPFDLGLVVVRAGLHIDPVTAQATVVSDPLPTILRGVPLRIRDVRLSMDRPGFMVNPTSCDEQQVAATVTSTTGTIAQLADRFQVADCERLPLTPKLRLALTGKGQTTDGKHPGVTARLTQPHGQSNLNKVKVTLPLSLALDVDNANGLCEFQAGSKPVPECPAASVVGSATAVTPLLNGPLTGPVYFVKNRRVNKAGREVATLPKIVAALHGTNGLRLTITGTSAVDKRNRLVTTFAGIPDAPVRSFRLNIAGGRHGILAVSNTNICKHKQRALQQIDGHNGKAADATITLKTPCRKRP